MKINKIYYSIQGEGVHQQIPMIFIRLQGCNLLNHCVWCDTSYAWDGNLGTEMSIEEIVNKCVELQPKTYRSWVCITGGEPLFQESDLFKLVKKLKNYGYRIEIETNGSIKKPWWYSQVDSWVADIKCPSSGVCGISLIDDWFHTRGDDQIKFVVGDKEDLDFAKKIINSKVAFNPVVLVSPVLDKIETDFKLRNTQMEWLQEVAEFCKEMRVRMSFQMHKIIWGNKEGV